MAIRTGEAPRKIIFEINITPLTDIFMVLLIFFMVTTTFLLEGQGFYVELPKASTTDAPPTVELTIYIAKSGTMYLNDKPVTMETFGDVLRAEKERTGKDLLVIKADEMVYHGVVVQVMDIAKQVGIEKLAVATEPKETKTE
jgi:biopolymer transport protein ExbD